LLIFVFAAHCFPEFTALLLCRGNNLGGGSFEPAASLDRLNLHGVLLLLNDLLLLVKLLL
jgi:hypothetical protein